MHPLASAPPAAPRPRRSEVETFWNSFSCDHSIAALQSVPAFLLQTPGGAPPLRRKSLNATCFLESVETGPVAYRPVTFLGQVAARSCSVQNKRIGFAVIKEV